MVVQPKRILWPTDFSELSLHGGRYARAFRDVFKADLHVIHVIAAPLSPETSLILPAEVPISVSEPEMVDGCRRALKQLVADHFGGDESIICEAFFGHAWSGICDYAKRKGIDLIIVATHGRTGLRHVLIGGTAERIVQHAPCPVLTVKMAEKNFLVD